MIKLSKPGPFHLLATSVGVALIAAVLLFLPAPGNVPLAVSLSVVTIAVNILYYLEW